MTIRVLHVITTLGRGGAERQLVQLVTNTARPEFAHTVCHLRAPADFAPEIERTGQRVVNLQLSGKHPWFAGARRLAQVMRAERPDLVQTWLYDASIVARLAQLLAPPVPLLNTLHSTDYEPETMRAYQLSPRKINLLRLVDKWTARLQPRTLYLPVSQVVADSNIKHLGLAPERVRVMYNSIDPHSLACEADAPRRLRAEFALPADAILFLNVGRMDLSKGQAQLLRAFAQVATAEARAYLLIVGEGFLMPELRRLARELGITERVRFAGRRSDVGAWLELADVFVFPSLVEGLPLAPVEAMIKGRACIATSIKPLREVFQDGATGRLVAPGAVAELAAAMLALARDPEQRARLGAQAQTEAMRRFHSRVAIPHWEALYRQAVSNGRLD
jgi:glycosyltransferase involved in cell wall biosynthesis